MSVCGPKFFGGNATAATPTLSFKLGRGIGGNALANLRQNSVAKFDGGAPIRVWQLDRKLALAHRILDISRRICGPTNSPDELEQVIRSRRAGNPHQLVRLVDAYP